MHSHPSGAALAATPPAPSGISYYPAVHRGTFGNIRAALASIGCTGAHAEVMIGNAQIEGSPVVAVPIKVQGAPADAGECVALVRRKPGGRADLFLGLLYLASEDQAAALDLAREMAENGAAGAARGCKVYVFEWARQRRAVQ